MADGRTVSGSARIPVKEMALEMLDQMFPHCTPEQINALKEGKPIPPSQDYKASTAQGYGIADLERCLRALWQQQHGDVTVSGIMLFGGPPERRRLAQSAVNQFVRQLYANKELVIINSTDTAITNRVHPQVKEIVVPKGTSLGAMRNRGVREAKGQWIMQWDDDDYYHPFRIAYHMIHRDPEKAVLLTRQIRVSVQEASAYLHYQPEGIACLGLYPNTVTDPYPDVAAGEDVAMWLTHWAANKTAVVNNESFPFSGLSIAVHHGRNVQSHEQFMVDYSSPEFRGKWKLSDEEIVHVKVTLASFGLKAEPKEFAVARS